MGTLLKGMGFRDSGRGTPRPRHSSQDGTVLPEGSREVECGEVGDTVSQKSG